MGKPRRKKKRTHREEVDDDSSGKAPKAFVIGRGRVGRHLNQLVLDLRQVMEPFTATRLKVNRRNVLKDFVHVAGPLGVTHLMMVSKSETHVNIKISRLPRGPTLTFHIKSFALIREVVASLRNPPPPNPLQYLTPALLVLNNFPADSKPSKLTTTMVQNMFPSINIQNVNLSSLKRCALFNYNSEDKMIEFRHYSVKVAPRGLSKGVRKVVQAKVPNLSKYEDISDLILGGNHSESECEEADDHVTVPETQLDSTSTSMSSQQSSIKLTELGPRMTLQLVKVEEGMCCGEVLYHDYIQKSVEEVKQMRRIVKEKSKLKEMRRKTQQENVRRKMQEREKQRVQQQSQRAARLAQREAQKKDDSDDDAEWYKREVGVNPDPELQLSTKGNGPTKRKHSTLSSSAKRAKHMLTKERTISTRRSGVSRVVRLRKTV